ncbi:MAG TPA: protein translocase subunit SecF [Candidatus Saccharimonadales bacterium]|nr:protein translocase subunit SecF [Candidatus Saccharimonadales bacterium]
MEFFRNTSIDFLGKKWIFLGFSLIFSVAGLLSIFFWHGMPWGVDFRQGTLVYVKFVDRPNEAEIRAALYRVGLRNVRLQRYDTAAKNSELIDLPQRAESGADVTHDRNLTIQALSGATAQGKQDLNNVGASTVRDELITRDPVHAAPQEYERLAHQIVDFRDKQRDGLFRNVEEAQQSGVPAAIVDALKQAFYTSNFHVFNAEIVGPQVGDQLRKQALYATLYSLAGMLVYLWFRFEMIYGVAAVVAVVHDTLITVGAFSLTNTDITLTVIAAILTLIGYSMNDTIVVFDRIRENIKIMRRESLAEIVNRSINQTLSRTILTSGLTFLTVLSLYLFGGEVLHGFSLALVIGILIGTYSSIAVAAPMLVAYQESRGQRLGGSPAPVPAQDAKGKVRVKA